MTDHPITPLHELIYQWKSSYLDAKRSLADLLTEAYQTGADQELEACCEWLDEVGPAAIQLWGDDLRNDRRPKPPSLKEQALETLRQIPIDPEAGVSLVELDTIRRALEQLND